MMKNSRRWWMAGMLFVLSAAACAPTATATPTQDIFAIQTEVAQTVQAGLTATSAAKPTATATLTPPPPTATATTEPTATLISTDQTLPSVTPAGDGGVSGTSPDKAVWMYNDPVDGTQVAPGQKFSVTWRIQNAGTTTWNQNYQMRYYLSDPSLRMGQADIKFPKEVKPNEQVDLTLSFTAPTTPGDYSTYWVLTNEEGVNFMLVTFTFKVGGTAPSATPGESSETSAPEATATTAATAGTPEVTATTGSSGG